MEIYFGHLTNKYKADFGLVSETPIVVYVKAPKANFICATSIDEAIGLVESNDDVIFVWKDGKWHEAVFAATLKKPQQRENVIKGFSP